MWTNYKKIPKKMSLAKTCLFTCRLYNKSFIMLIFTVSYLFGYGLQTWTLYISLDLAIFNLLIKNGASQWSSKYWLYNYNFELWLIPIQLTVWALSSGRFVCFSIIIHFFCVVLCAFRFFLQWVLPNGNYIVIILFCTKFIYNLIKRWLFVLAFPDGHVQL